MPACQVQIYEFHILPVMFEDLHTRVCQVEIDLDRGFVKPHLNFV